MNAVKKYLKLRKQNDSVKLITILFVMLIVVLILFASKICKYYRTVNTKTEYVLACSDNLERVKLKLGKIKEMDGNIAAGTEKNYYITLNNGETSVMVRECSADYLLKAYNINDKAFYLNESAYKILNNKSTEFMALYQKENSTLNGSFRLNKALSDGTPYAFKVGTSASLGTESESVIVAAMFKNADISGETAKALEGLGFEIKNKFEIEKQEYNREMFLVKIKYEFYIILLIVLFIAVLLKQIKKLQLNKI